MHIMIKALMKLTGSVFFLKISDELINAECRMESVPLNHASLLIPPLFGVWS